MEALCQQLHGDKSFLSWYLCGKQYSVRQKMFFLRKKVFLAICRAEEQTCALATNEKFIS